MFNALQYAKRGLSVAIIDELTETDKNAYKVGESLLTFSNPMLRTVGDLDNEISVSFEKSGLWFLYGYEGQDDFDGVTEWAQYTPLPSDWREKLYGGSFGRAMFQDAQIVRPEVEAVLRERMAKQPLITVVDTGRVADVEFGSDGEPHVTTWRSRDRARSSSVRSRWVVDCSGRKRFLGRRLGLGMPLDGDFVTSAVWGQFSGCTDADFDDWEYTFPEGGTARRDYTTVHLWGDGYWIWLIRLTEDRISVGVSLNRRILEPGDQLREVFWRIIRRYPALKFLGEDNLLDFSAYKNIQHISEVHVSPDRFIVAGDAASIIDAYYSQGMSQAMLTSWHGANIVERDVCDGVLDTDYIDHVNRSMKADWLLIRSMVKHKFSPSIADSRFFILDHLLDYLVFAAIIPARYRMAMWLIRTDGGRPELETPETARTRRWLEKHAFLNRSVPFRWLNQESAVAFVDLLRSLNRRNAQWRLDNGVKVPPMDGVIRLVAPLPAAWRMPIGQLRNRPVSITPPLPNKPVNPPDFEAGLPFAFRVFALAATPIVGFVTAFDSALTSVQRVGRGLASVVRRGDDEQRKKRRQRRPVGR
ncbi:NAD(P)/FAD-dependent oxidoreductase [Nocardiopsis sp. JB363]|uniref:NAD(P)/FAD-dependent oxidoreductase n=1 Tax=Nocardiopsis sp. JB363 TaxID=1434837 RepID=UPI00097A3FCC|nr:Halogenase [Nocardiopsis sp. JB363]